MKAKKYIVYILLVIVAFFLGSMIVGKVISDKNKRIIESIEKEQREREYKDSVSLANYQKEIDRLSYEYSVVENRNDSYKKDISKLKNEYSKLKSEYGKIDYNSGLDSCILVVEIQEIAIEKADSIILSQDSLIKNKDNQISIMFDKYNTELTEKERIRFMYESANKNIETLKKSLEKENTWWKRNGKWVFLGAGLTTGVFLAK